MHTGFGKAVPQHNYCVHVLEVSDIEIPTHDAANNVYKVFIIKRESVIYFINT